MARGFLQKFLDERVPPVKDRSLHLRLRGRVGAAERIHSFAPQRTDPMTESAEHLQPSRGSGGSPPGGDLIGLLTTRVESLVERFRAAQQRIRDLDAKLAERDRCIGELKQAQEASKRRRRDVRKRIDRLIAQVGRLERAGG